MTSEFRVTAMYYRFASETGRDDFGRAAPSAGTLGVFDCALSDGILKAVPTVEFRDREAAKQALEPYLRDWEQAAFLSPRAHRLRFEYEGSDVEEIDPQPRILNVFPEAATGSGSAFGATVVTRVNREYPPFDAGFTRTPLTDLLAERLRRTRDGGELWPAFAYFVLTQLEAGFGGAEKGDKRRRKMARTLAVEWPVVARLGEITARPDPEIGRKAAKDPAPITASERGWMEVVVVRFIRRVGEHAAGGPLTPITMADVPPLT